VARGRYELLLRVLAHTLRRPDLALYGGTVVEGYQLHRLQTELERALDDTERKPSSFDVLVGWSSEKPSVETESWQRLEKVEVLALIASLLAMVRHSAASGLKLIVSGD
jgi:hypothetical protein